MTTQDYTCLRCPLSFGSVRELLDHIREAHD